MLEIPRNVTANVWKLVGGILMLALALLIGLDAPDAAIEDPRHWFGPSIVVVLAIPLVASNVRILIRRPPCLCATSDGVWFGGGPIIPWREIKGVYDAGVPIEHYGYKVRTRALGFEFHRKWTLLRLPSSLWLTTIAVGDVKVSVLAAQQEPVALVCQLDGMRRRASDPEAGPSPQAAALPRARVVH